MILIYDLFIRLFLTGIRIASIWNKKADAWIKGRENLFEELRNKINAEDKIIWMHCASAGEFEQGKPVIEELKDKFPDHKILVSFFSPSGYAVAKRYAHADIVTYLPIDTKKNAKKFIKIVKPQLVVFVKYEYWYHHLKTITTNKIPLILVSAIFRKEQIFFKWYGKFYRQMLFFFHQIFVQDENSLQLLKQNGINNCLIGGDTRFDRVVKIAESFSELVLIKNFVGDNQVIVAGSTWPDDEKLFAEYAKSNEVKLIIAPHEINDQHIASIQKLFPGAFKYSEFENLLSTKPSEYATSVWNKIDEQQTIDLQKKLTNVNTLIIDNVGMLSKLYNYATISFIGGGFNKSGIHNTLEAAVYGNPVLFGSYYKKFKEANDLIAVGAAFPISNAEELKIKMDHLLNDPSGLATSGNAAKNYVSENTGATKKIIQYIQENRLLTNW